MRTRIQLAVLSLAGALLSAPLRAQGVPGYDVIQFLKAPSGVGPANILGLDNNGAVLLAARSGILRDSLPPGLPASASQLRLLQDWRLLEERDDTLYPAIPILDSAATLRLRQAARRAARMVADSATPALRQLNHALERSGHASSGYSIAFSYVLDGLVWAEFERSGLLPERRVTAERPFWSGEVWAIQPRRAYQPGTNSLSDRGISFKVTWREEAIRLMLPLFADWPSFLAMFENYADSGRVTTRRALDAFTPLGLIGRDGSLTVPVIHEGDPADSLSHAAADLAHRVARASASALDLPRLRREFGFSSDAQTLVIAYHELLWEVLGELESRGLIVRPRVLADPSTASPADVAALVFVVRA